MLQWSLEKTPGMGGYSTNKKKEGTNEVHSAGNFWRVQNPLGTFNNTVTHQWNLIAGGGIGRAEPKTRTKRAFPTLAREGRQTAKKGGKRGAGGEQIRLANQACARAHARTRRLRHAPFAEIGWLHEIFSAREVRYGVCEKGTERETLRSAANGPAAVSRSKAATAN